MFTFYVLLSMSAIDMSLDIVVSLYFISFSLLLLLLLLLYLSVLFC